MQLEGTVVSAAVGGGEWGRIAGVALCRRDTIWWGEPHTTALRFRRGCRRYGHGIGHGHGLGFAQVGADGIGGDPGGASGRLW